MLAATNVGSGREPGLRARLAAVLLLSLALAGCGASGATTTTRKLPPIGHSYPTAKLFPKPAAVPAAVSSQEREAHAQLMKALHAPMRTRYHAGIPSYIPRGIAVDRVVTATATRPVLAVAGIGVRVVTATGTALMLLNGPLYSNRYQGTNLPQIPAKWTVKITDVHGTIPIRPKDFTIFDDNGYRITPAVGRRGGGALPKEVRTGQSVTVLLATIIAAGDGSVQYSPRGVVRPGNKPLAGWDFVIEDD